MTENSLIGYALAWGVCSAATAVAMRWAIVQAGNQATRDALWQRKRTKYLFNKDTGEWRKILTKGSNGRVNVDSRSRRERLTEETKEFESAQKGAIKGPFFLWAGIGAVAYIGLQGTSGLVEKCFQIAVISIALLLPGLVATFGSFQSFCAARVIDPPACPISGDDFGPLAGGLLNTGEAVPLDEYRPNA